MNKRILVILFAVVMLFGIPVASFAAQTLEPEEQFNASVEFERGTTVLPNGDVFVISGKTLKGYHSDGTAFYNAALPTEYCGNLVSTSDGYVIAHNYTAPASIYIYKPGDTSYKTLSVGKSCQALAVGDDGYLYNIRGENGKTVIERAKLSTLLNLETQSSITWEKQYYPDYTAPSGKNCYPSGIAVHGGYAYIADKGSSSGYDSAVSGIYKYNLKSGAVTAMQFSSDKVQKLTWVYAVSVNKNGVVAVVGRNSNMIAVFQPGSKVAEYMVGAGGWCEDVAFDANGDMIFAYYKNPTVGSYVSKVTIPRIDVEGVSISPKSKTITMGSNFTVAASINPSNATNRNVTYSSSKTSVTTVSTKGLVTAKAVGKAYIKVTTEDGNKTASCTVYVNPKKPAVSSATSGKGYVKVKMSKTAKSYGASYFKIGYKVKGTSTWKYKTTSSQTLTIKNLKKGKKYNIKVLAYKKVDGRTYSSAYSSIRTSAAVK